MYWIKRDTNTINQIHKSLHIFASTLLKFVFDCYLNCTLKAFPHRLLFELYIKSLPTQCCMDSSDFHLLITGVWSETKQWEFTHNELYYLFIQTDLYVSRPLGEIFKCLSSVSPQALTHTNYMICFKVWCVTLDNKGRVQYICTPWSPEVPSKP